MDGGRDDLRSFSAGFIDGASGLSAELDGQPLTHLRRVQSKVFAVALPEDNVFDAQCAGLGGVPAGIYAPAGDDGYYVRIDGLEPGDHTLRIRAENVEAGVGLDVTYRLAVVQVTQD